MKLGFVVGTVVVGILFGVPIAYALMLMGLLYIALWVPFGLGVTPEQIFNAATAPALLAIPFYMLLGELVVEGRLARRLADFAGDVIGHFRGGLGHVSIVSNLAMAGIQGSEAADIAALGRIFVPEMERSGYSRRYAAALVATAAVLGPIIPPSIPLVIYGSATGASIGDLFLGGLVPGLLFALALLGSNAVLTRRRGYPAQPRARLRTAAIDGARSMPILAIPLVVIVGISSGYFTPTESGAIAVLVAAVVGFAYRDLTIRGLLKAIWRFVGSLGPMMLIVATSGVFSYVLTLEQVGPRLVSALHGLLSAVGGRSWIVMLILVAAVLVVGSIIETVTLIIVLGPVLLQVAQAAGIDPIHFGVVFTVSVLMGTLHPPIGYGLLIGSTVAGLEPEDLIKEMLILLVPLLIVLVVIAIVPQLVTFVPYHLIAH